MKRFVVGLLWLAGILVGRAADLPALNFGAVTEKQLWIPMRDGVRLSAYAYFPAGAGPWPVIFQLRYNTVAKDATRRLTAKLAEKNFVVVNVNFRGAQLSEGDWVGYRTIGWGERQDGYDTCEWLAAQSWSTGKVGTFGNSQAGFAQNLLAVTRPPHLVAQYMVDTGLSLFHEGYRIGGTTRPERFKVAIGDMGVARVPEHHRRLMEEWFEHPHYDAYWQQEDASRHFERMDLPCFTVGSWYDFMCAGSVDSFVGRQHRGGPGSRGRQQLLLGPWLHGGAPKPNKVGELTYPENARFDVDAHMLRWFDHYLKGIDNGAEREPVVRYYVMGAAGEPGAPGNGWREAADWPVAASPTSYFLQPGGALATTAPAAGGGSTTWLADPLHPAEIKQAGIPVTSFPGARDARNFEAQPNVLTFTTAPLAEPVEWTGRVATELWVTSTAKDTDFIVRVSDVYPDGRSMLIVDSIRRARYREGFEQEKLLTPGAVHRVAFDLGWLSLVFNRGHRIRVTVASTGVPFYEPNPNTGAPLTLEFPSDAVVARNTLFHHAGGASRIIAPVRP